ncbi:MAG: DUF3097 family protein, partial [Nocardioidaceae bacterium]
MPSWSSGSGATTFGSRASSSRSSAASTTWRGSSRTSSPTASRRLGVLVDHLVAGSKEARIADEIRHEHVLVVGHPYVDIWQAVKPTALGITDWPEVPKGQSWKHGVLTALGWPASTPADVAAAWKR